MSRLLVALALALALAAPAHAADTVLAQVPEPVPVAAQDGALAYSRHDDAGWRLVLWANGVARDAPVAPRAGPFDVDLGHGRRKQTVATYSRGGRIHVLDLETGRDRALRIRGTSPSMWWPYVAYATRGRLRERDLRRPGPYRLGAKPLSWDVRGGRVVAAVDYSQPGTDRRDLAVQIIGGRLLMHHTSGLLSIAELTRPHWVGPHSVFVAQVRRIAEGQRFVFLDSRTSARRQALGRRNVLEAAVLGRRVAYVNTGAEEGATCGTLEAAGPCPVAITPPLTFR